MGRLNELSPAALKAAMRTGTAEWGQRASAFEHAMYVEPVQSRRRCRHDGCRKRITHNAMANGIALSSGCEFHAHQHAKEANDARSASSKKERAS